MERFLELIKLKLLKEASADEAGELERVLQSDKELAIIYNKLFEGWPEKKNLCFADAEAAYAAHYPKWKQLNE